MKKIVFLLVFVFTLCFFSFAQQEKIEYDSLIIEMGNYIEYGEFEKAISLGNKMMIDEQNSDYYGKILSELGIAYWYSGAIKKGDSLFIESLKIANNISDTSVLIKSNFNLGYISLANGDYVNSLKYFFEAEKYAIHECVELSKIKDYISYVYITQENTLDAEKFVKEAFKLAIECDDSFHIVNMYNSIGYFYIVSYKNDSAFSHLNTALSLAVEIGYLNGEAIALSNLTDLYLYQEDFQNALLYSNKSLAIDKQLNDIEGQAYSYGQIGEIYRKSGNYGLSIISLEKAIVLADKLNAKNLKVDFLKSLADAQKQIGNIQDSWNTLSLHYSLQDSLNGVEKAKDINELMEKYETEKITQEKEQAEINEQYAQELATKNRNLFIASIIGGGALLLLALFFIYQLQLKKRAELAEVKLLDSENKRRLERQVNDAEMKALKSQMNPHFLFNAFNSIQEFIILNNRELASDYLGKFADLMRLYLDHSREKTILLEKEIDATSLYLELEKIRFEDTLTYAIEIAENIDTSAIKLPPMLIQPFIENSLKHGLLHKKDNRQLKVAFSLESNILICIVEDNGIGRKQSTLLNEKRMKTHKSFATSATQNRIELLNIGREKDITLRIIDLEDENENAIGTKVEIKIPLT